MRKILPRVIGIGIFLSLCLIMMGMKDEGSVDDWFFEDDSEAKALAVNEGQLEFLTKPAQKIPHLLENTLTIMPTSLDDGWVDLLQCHHNIDAVYQAQILYHDNRTRNLSVISRIGIEKAWIEGKSVQLENITHDAKVCIHAEVKSLHSSFNGSYILRNGPFLRKFLDGYYPMHVTMDVKIPDAVLAYEDVTPPEQQGFAVSHAESGMKVDALFVGELSIEMHFEDKRPVVN